MAERVRYRTKQQELIRECLKKHSGRFLTAEQCMDCLKADGLHVGQTTVYRALDRLGLSPLRLTPEERMEIIAGLEADGIFLLKGAVKPVADALQCSQASIYRYLSQIRRDRTGQHNQAEAE